MEKRVLVIIISFLSIFPILSMGIMASAEAALITYTNESLWSTAVGPASGTENFNAFASDTSFRLADVNANNMILRQTNGLDPFVDLIDAAPFELAGFYATNNDSYLLTKLSGTLDFRIDFTSSVSAWGATFTGISDSESGKFRNSSIMAFDAADALLGTVSTASDNTAAEVQFYGFGLTSGSAAYLTFQNSTDNVDYWGMDDVAFVTAGAPGAPVPEPATIALLGIGLAGFAGGAARRKWKKKAVDKS